MTEIIQTVIVGGGQAGLSLSYYLTQRGHPHVVLEQAEQAGHTWRKHRWDSFTFVTPNWQVRLPGTEYQGDDPDGFLPRQEIIAYFEGYVERFSLPVRYNVLVSSVESTTGRDGYRIQTSAGLLEAANVVIATGLYQRPKVPSLRAAFPAHIQQLHSSAYHNPEALPPGAVLVVGSGQSGCQIAEELCHSGRKVFLATGRTGRVPRRYRGKDSAWWANAMGLYDRTVDMLASPRDRFADHPHLSGTQGGHTLNLHQFVRDGMTLLGRLASVSEGTLQLAPDLKENLAFADQFEANTVKAIDEYIAARGLSVPEGPLPRMRDGYAQKEILQLDLASAGITSVIWATGYTFDFHLVRLPVLDADGYPVQQRGVTTFPGLYFLGLPWLHNAKSGLLFGVGDDAAFLAARIPAPDRRPPHPEPEA
jgi:putative flavoprotein involved in K+ transport